MAVSFPSIVLIVLRGLLRNIKADKLIDVQREDSFLLTLHKLCQPKEFYGMLSAFKILYFMPNVKTRFTKQVYIHGTQTVL